jgi:hypothetical protein
MTLGVNYFFGKPGSGKTFLSDEIEERFLSNDGFNSIPVDDSNLEGIISSLNEYENTLLIIQSNKVSRNQVKALREFIENPDFIRGVVIQSELEPDSEVKKYCHYVYETGYPIFSWVTQVEENEWVAKSIKLGEIWKSNGKIQAIEFARDYK